MRDESNWFSRWEEELPSPEELVPLSQTLISPDLAIAFDIRNSHNTPTQHKHHPELPHQPPPSSNPLPSPGTLTQPSSADFAVSAELGDEPARTLKRPRLVWTPQLHKRFVDAVAQMGIKNAMPKTIMQLMSVDGLTRENVASHLQKYRLYLKRMQGLSGGGAGSGSSGGIPGLATSDPATDHLFASSPVPAHFLHPAPGRQNSDHFLSFVQVPALHQQMVVAAAATSHPQYHRQMGHFGSPPNGQFEHPFLSRQSQGLQQIGPAPVHSPVAGYVEDMESANASGGRKLQFDTECYCFGSVLLAFMAGVGSSWSNEFVNYEPATDPGASMVKDLFVS